MAGTKKKSSAETGSNPWKILKTGDRSLRSNFNRGVRSGLKVESFIAPLDIYLGKDDSKGYRARMRVAGEHPAKRKPRENLLRFVEAKEDV